MESDTGFIAALDQSGGSTPKTLEQYGVPRTEYEGNEALMFELVHDMRVRIMTNSAFARPNILGAILFERTMRGDVEGLKASEYLWQRKNILPFLKIDNGLSSIDNGVHLMKPIVNLSARLEEAKSLDVFGTKMRSVIMHAQQHSIKTIVDQQFAYAKEILAHGLYPIVEPEVDINAPDKQACERMLRDELRSQLQDLQSHEQIIFKLTLPEIPNFYREFTEHPQVLRVAALSGGYSQAESIERLKANDKMIASYSRALTQELRRDSTDEEFSAALSHAITGIAGASLA